MKKIFTLFAVLLLMQGARADEGMWIPMLIGKNYEDMQRKGLKLTKEDLYDINHSSLKDAILQFGGGCTAEMISSNGLLLTNHHCGYDAIASLSTVERNLLDNGFWALSMKEELPAKGVTALFLLRVEDITDKVQEACKGLSGDAFTKKYDSLKKQIEEKESNKGALVANVRDFFNGNQTLLLIYRKYTDVRLVGNPPKSLGKYGGDIDNWMWPRHTSDFSVFRIYADSNNMPKAYNANNVPYHPAKFLPISIKGEKEHDFAMIFGYPGRTNRYDVSYAVDMAINDVNPSIVTIRDLRLAIMKRHMDKDKAVYLKLTSSYSSIANYWKYYIGQTEQLKRLNVVDQKTAAEKEFTAWARSNSKTEAAGLISEYQSLVASIKPIIKQPYYYNECFRSPAVTKMAMGLKPMYDWLTRCEKDNVRELNQDSLKKYAEMAKSARRDALKTFDPETDKEMFALMTKLYYDNIPKSQLPSIYNEAIFKKGNEQTTEAFNAYTENVFAKTFVTDSNAYNEICDHPTLKALHKDPLMKYALSFAMNYEKNYKGKVDSYSTKKMELNKKYLRYMMEWKSDKMFYPDANSTMRISYGEVASYEPQDAVHYNYFTTLDGLMAKYKPGNEDFDVPKDLITLYKAKDYGRYADKDGSLHTCFITNNDITGGNSGSPVMNENGELIGTAFDGNWEAMSGDIAFDKNYKRTIVCDIRFVLFLMDKMGHASNLIKEMDIRE
jgi:Peptidase S46